MEYCAKSEAITNEFNKGDNGQWIKRTGENTFTIVEVSLYENYYVKEIKIDLLKLTEDDITLEISVYYDSLEELKSDYPTTWKQFIAETIADHTEVDNKKDKCFYNKDNMIKYLEEVYNIKYNE